MKSFPESGSIEELPPEIIDEFLDNINHIKRDNMWEKFKEIGYIHFTDINLVMCYSEGNIICFKRMDNESVIVYNIEFEKKKEEK